jgi:hypothetical protein
VGLPSREASIAAYSDQSAPPSHDFDRLRSARRQLTEICKVHITSIEFFRAPGGAWFKLTSDEKLPTQGAEIHHMSTSASCAASLADSADVDKSKFTELISAFSSGAFSRPERDWKSEGAADTYCRVRTLPVMLEHAPDELIQANLGVIERLVEFAWKDVKDPPPFQAIAEHPFRHRPKSESDRELDYPPNCFLTYWGLRTLRDLGRRNISPLLIARHKTKWNLAMLWSEGALATQTALWSIRSPRFDPHQLAWAIATIVEFSDAETLRRPATIGLLKSGLSAFFGSQQPDGSWARGDPLFHYPDSGNAYCFIFETLAELVRPALDRDRGQPFRDLLEPHYEQLLGAWDLAQATSERLAEGVRGWCSGHHPHRTRPEGWATAATFSFLQQLRCLIGLWTRKYAARELGVTTSRWTDFDKATEKIAQIGNTWSADGWALADRLGGLFINPVLRGRSLPARLDPDLPLVNEAQARSALLFGPPGTGKTTLVEAVAGAIGWDYLEIQPSAFLTNGIDNVAARADLIFSQLMELNRCVILFDEIDELIRNRGDKDSDPFGRFLTTTMLPKLAKLWAQRRVLFFANTNWITKADPAIRRSQRFDAVLFVAPPSFSIKKTALERVLTGADFDKVTEDSVSSALAKPKDPLGWIALLRHEHVSDLVRRLEKPANEYSTYEDLLAALKAMGSQLEKTDWDLAPSDGEPSHPYTTFIKMADNVSVDGSRECLAWLRTGQVLDAPIPPENFLTVDSRSEPKSSLQFGELIGMRGPLLQYKPE